MVALNHDLGLGLGLGTVLQLGVQAPRSDRGIGKADQLPRHGSRSSLKNGLGIAPPLGTTGPRSDINGEWGTATQLPSTGRRASIFVLDFNLGFGN